MLPAPVLPAPVVLSVIYALLAQVRKCRNLRVFGANFLGPNLYLCYSNRLLHLCLQLGELGGNELHAVAPQQVVGSRHTNPLANSQPARSKVIFELSIRL